MVLKHLAVEAPPRFALCRIATGVWRQLSRGCANDGAPPIVDGDVEPEIRKLSAKVCGAAPSYWCLFMDGARSVRKL